MRLGDIIFAPTSAPGLGGHGVVRVSGPGCLELLRAMAPDVAPHGCAVLRRAGFALLTIGGVRLPARVITFAAPRSFTGEDSWEVLVPGGPVATERVLAALRANPQARAALPGEFSARAFLNGRLSADEAERLPDLIGACTLAEVDAARRARPVHHVRGWIDRLAHLLALVESGIDFVDQEDVSSIGPGELTDALTDVLTELREFLARGAGEAGGGEPVVVLVGPPSAGKSSLFNALLALSAPGRQPEAFRRVRAVTHESPGTTRDALRAPLDLGEARRVTLVDTPGIEGPGALGGAAAAESQAPAQAQAAAQRAAEAADLIVWCDPLCREPGGPLATASSGRAPPLIRVRTKADRPGPTRPGWTSVCALDGRGLGRLKIQIARAVAACAGEARERPSVREARAIADAASSLKECLGGLSGAAGGPVQAEVVAEHLRSALGGLGEVASPVGVDEILGRIFARSCIGK